MKDLIIPLSILAIVLGYIGYETVPKVAQETYLQAKYEIAKQEYHTRPAATGLNPVQTMPKISRSYYRTTGNRSGTRQANTNSSGIRNEVLTHVIAPCYERLASSSNLRGHMSQSDIQATLVAGTYSSSKEATDSIVRAAKGMTAKQRQRLYRNRLARCTR